MTDLILWEALDADDPALAQARLLYEATQSLDERIPWDWIRGGVARRKQWKPGRWATHLLLAARRGTKKKVGDVVGFANAVHVPGFGGYLSYIGVDPTQRGLGIGRRLIDSSKHLLRADACFEGSSLPFLVWESKPPVAGDEEGAEVWRARLGLWRSAGASWVSGTTIHAVNYMNKHAPPLRLALFLLPDATPASSFEEEALRGVVAGLLEEVYGKQKGDEHCSRSLPPDARLELRPVSEAGLLTSAR